MKEATSTVVVAKKDKAKDKRVKDITALVTTASEILKRLDHLDPNELLRLKIDEVYAILVKADPQDSISNPNKKAGQEKAKHLSIVLAVRRNIGVAKDGPPPLIPIPEAPLIYEETFMSNL